MTKTFEDELDANWEVYARLRSKSSGEVHKRNILAAHHQALDAAIKDARYCQICGRDTSYCEVCDKMLSDATIQRRRK